MRALPFGEFHLVRIGGYRLVAEVQLIGEGKTGRGIPMISSKYGEGAFDFCDNDIIVTISFSFINEVGNKTEENGLDNPQT